MLRVELGGRALWARGGGARCAAAAHSPASADTLETRARAGLPEQSAAQRPARAGARDRRKRAAGFVGLSAEDQRDRDRMARNTPTPRRSVTDASPAAPVTTRSRTNSWVDPRSVGAHADPDALSTASRPATARARPKAQVLAARETLRVIEQTVLLDAATSYMNVLRDTAILDLQRRNVEVLQEQLRQTRDRFNVGEVTRTDVAQAESRVAAAQSQMLAAQGEPHHLARHLSPRDRRRARQARARHAGRPAFAAHARSRGRAGPGGKPRGQRGASTASMSPPCRSRSPRARSIRPSR